MLKSFKNGLVDLRGSAHVLYTHTYNLLLYRYVYYTDAISTDSNNGSAWVSVAK